MKTTITITVEHGGRDELSSAISRVLYLVDRRHTEASGSYSVRDTIPVAPAPAPAPAPLPPGYGSAPQAPKAMYDPYTGQPIKPEHKESKVTYTMTTKEEE